MESEIHQLLDAFIQNNVVEVIIRIVASILVQGKVS